MSSDDIPIKPRRPEDESCATNSQRHNADIPAIDPIEGMRTRPKMYLGDVHDPLIINQLLQEALCISLDNALSGCADQIQITLHRDRSFTIWDSGPPLPFREDNGDPVFENMFTKLYACREAKRSSNRQLCRVGLVVVNVFSQWLRVECGVDGRHWRQTYRQGHPQGEFVDVGSSKSTWEQISFLPDEEFFTDRRLDVPQFLNWIERQHFELPGCRITLHDEFSGEESAIG